MLKIKVFTIGKCKESWLSDAIDDYTRRLQGQLSIEWIIVNENSKLIHLLQKEPRYIALDVRGQSLSSEAFAHFIQKELIAGGARLSLAIGGSDGLPPEIIENASARISLSPLTFTHQMTRLILLEQLYRAFEILKGSPYHK